MLFPLIMSRPKILEKKKSYFLWFLYSQYFQPCAWSLTFFPPFFPFTLPSSLFLASGVSLFLIRPYLWSNLAATAWVSVARRVVPLSCPAVAEINPRLNKASADLYKLPNLALYNPFKGRFVVPRFRWGTGHVKIGVCACVHVCERVRMCGVRVDWVSMRWTGDRD